MTTTSDPIRDAICLVDQAKRAVQNGEQLSVESVNELLLLMDQTQVLRNQMVQLDLARGIPGKEVAVKYNLSEARVSQIKRLVMTN